ncbi:MTH1187 family thiamine-binding protein [Desulfobulbus sp. TB]|nr:MTH1187 family thiamine-binding protein [Desulfobulbus sp. TB]
MAFMQITVLPMETGTSSLSQYIAALQEILQEQDADYEINDMGTVINGTPATLFRLAEKLHSCPFEYNEEYRVQRVITQITLDERRDKTQGLGEKKEAVLNMLANTRI